MKKLSLQYPYNYIINDNAHRQHITTPLNSLVYGRYAYSLIDTVLGQRLGVLSTLWKRTFFVHEKDLLWFFTGLRKVRSGIFNATRRVPLSLKGYYERLDNQEPFNFLRLWVRIRIVKLLWRRFKRFERKRKKRSNSNFLRSQLLLRTITFSNNCTIKYPIISKKRKRLSILLILIRLVHLGKYNILKLKNGSIRFRHFFRSICLARYVICRRLFFSSPTWAAKRSRGTSSKKHFGRSRPLRRRIEHSSFAQLIAFKRNKRFKNSTL